MGRIDNQVEEEHKKFVKKRLLGYAKEEKKPLVLGLFTTFFRTMLEMAGPLIIGHIINQYLSNQMTDEIFYPIFKWLILYLLIYLLSGFVSNYSRIFFEEAANEITLKVQEDIYQHVQLLPIAYFDSLPAGSIVSRITNDTNRLKHMFQLVLADMTTSSIMVISLYLMILITNFRAALLLLLTVPIILVLFYDLRKKTAIHTSKIRHYTSEINSNINENIQNMEIIQAFNQEMAVESEFNDINDKIYRHRHQMVKVRSYGGYRAMDIVQYFAVILVLIYFGLGQITGAYPVNIGSLYIIVDYTTKMFTNLQTMVSRSGELEQSFASAIHVFDLLYLDVEVEGSQKLKNAEGEITFDNVSFAYDKEKVLKNISFRVKNGESIAFVGSTGSGKSTLLNLLLNFYSPQEGKICIDGQDIKEVNRSSLREDMAVVLQDAFLFETSIYENISLGEEFSKQEVRDALMAVGGESLVERGIDTVVIEQGKNLSQGEEQLIAFARAYIRNPKILILDEATSNIDTETELIIQEGIDRLKENRTTFIIAHRLSTIKDVDKILVLDRGRIIERGNHAELIQQEGFYRSMYEEQMRESYEIKK